MPLQLCFPGEQCPDTVTLTHLASMLNMDASTKMAVVIGTLEKKKKKDIYGDIRGT